MTLSDEQRLRLQQGGPDLVVIGLCAAWCATCREFQDTFKALEARHPKRLFIWLDIEDDSAYTDELDIENFPSLAVFRAGEAVFFGVTEPQESVVERLLQAMSDAPARPVPDAVELLYKSVRDAVSQPAAAHQDQAGR